MQFNAQQVIAKSGIAFGTSGARGLVRQFTPELCAAFALAFVAVLAKDAKRIAIGIDNRPSSPAIASFCIAALQQQGIGVDYYGVLPTPALAFAAMQQGSAAIMVTGSHIPFDRNGLKFYRPDGEITKADEQAMVAAGVSFDFAHNGTAALPLPVVNSAATELYLQRYRQFFPADLAKGLRIGVYEHSSAGRDLYARLMREFGAEVISLGRSDQFVPIDTEAVSMEDEAKAKAWALELQLDAIFSTDGDGDRPLVADEQGEWFRGDILGLLAAKALALPNLAVPVSCNSAIEASGYFRQVARTKIGSPYVIAGFAELPAPVAGFEANGGFLLGSDLHNERAVLKALPTRDAVLPFLAVLQLAKGQPLSQLKAQLPASFTYSDRLVNFATAKSQALIAKATLDAQQFVAELGLQAQVIQLNTTDGLRLTLSDDTVVHIRPSGNAPELRCYAESDDSASVRNLVIKLKEKLPVITLD